MGEAEDELVDQRIGRAAHLLGRSRGDEFAAVQQHHTVGDAKGAAHVVGDDNAGDAELAVEVHDELVDFGAGDGVEAGAGFVVEEDFGVQGDGAGQAGAFFHSAGKLGGHFVGVGAQADFFQLDLDDDFDRLLGQIGVLPERQGDVVGHGHRVEQSAALEEDADGGAVGGELGGGHGSQVFSQANDVAGSRRQVADHQAQQRGFPRTRAAQNDQRFAVADFEVDAVQDASAVEFLGEVLNLDDDGFHTPKM